MEGQFSRRSMFQIAGALAGAGLAQSAAPAKDDPSGDFKLGVCTYCVRNFQRGMAISLLKQLGVSYVSVKEFHLPYTSTPDEAAKARAEFEKAGLKIASGGTITFNDPATARKYFDYAKMCGMASIVAAPTHEILPQLEKLVKEYDIKLAIHTHGPEDKNFPNPQSVLAAVKNLDPRVGVCMDIGHSMRTGVNVVDTVGLCGPRLLGMHFKDLKVATDKDSQCEVGRGVMPIVAIFKQLKKMGYSGIVDLEYEINADNPLPGMDASLAYMRGALAGMAG